MKRILALGLSTIVALPLMSTAIVWAQSGSDTNTTTTQTTAATVDDEQKQLSDADKTAIKQRLEKRKAELKTKLTNAEKLNLQNKCKAAQGSVFSIKGRTKGIETSRSEVYKNIINRLTDLSTKLKNKGVDTTKLNADIAELQTKITTFNTDLVTYKQAVSDLADMDCKTDPEGFKASLQTARTALDTLTKDGQAIKSYVNDTVKPELKKIHDALESDTTGGNH